MKKIESGFLITIEGIDGSGKSSLVEFLKEHLLNLNFGVITTKEPGGTDLGLYLRELLQNGNFNLKDKVEYLLFAADRAQHISEVVKPALNNGFIVISDRMADSSLAYQCYGRGLDLDSVKFINNWTMDGIKPDLTLYLKIDYETSIKRIIKRHEKLTNFEKKKPMFFEKVINGFETIFKNRDNVITIDATKSFDEVKADAISSVLNLINSKLLR